MPRLAGSAPATVGCHFATWHSLVTVAILAQGTRQAAASFASLFDLVSNPAMSELRYSIIVHVPGLSIRGVAILRG